MKPNRSWGRVPDCWQGDFEDLVGWIQVFYGYPGASSASHLLFKKILSAGLGEGGWGRRGNFSRLENPLLFLGSAGIPSWAGDEGCARLQSEPVKPVKKRGLSGLSPGCQASFFVRVQWRVKHEPSRCHTIPAVPLSPVRRGWGESSPTGSGCWDRIQGEDPSWKQPNVGWGLVNAGKETNRADLTPWLLLPGVRSALNWI